MPTRGTREALVGVRTLVWYHEPMRPVEALHHDGLLRPTTTLALGQVGGIDGWWGSPVW